MFKLETFPRVFKKQFNSVIRNTAENRRVVKFMERL